MSDLLILSITIPLGMALLIAILPRKMPEWPAKALALAGFALPALFSIQVFLSYFREGDGGFLYQRVIPTGLDQSLGIALRIGVNGISVVLLLLAAIVGLAAGWAAIVSNAERKRTYLVLLLIMFSGLLGIFSTYDIFYLYFFHEVALIPSFIMIAIWGGPNRRPAAMNMTVYLTLGAMVSLAGLIGIYVGSGLGSFDLISLSEHLASQPFATTLGQTLFGLLLFGLGILVSLFPFHSWAPLGYTAAPTSVAMLHAGVLKKFGLYTLIQVGLPLLGSAAFRWTDTLAVLALGNIIIIGLITMAQRDLKQMISYASVMHMGYIFLGIATVSMLGAGGAVFLMLAHGLSVAALFHLATAIQHRCRTFNMEEMGGLGKEAPVLCGLFMTAMLASIGLPGFANFWGEFTVFASIWQWKPLVLVIALTGIVISAIYGLRAVAKTFFGQPTEAFREIRTRHLVSDIGWAERIPAVILLIALLIFGLIPHWAGNPVEKAIAGIWQKQSDLNFTGQRLDVRDAGSLIAPDEVVKEEAPQP
ncbi:MAG: NAD(P)H-quinone oxidoreductase chain 4 1 [Verrucomicrobia bacterium ADurb.Bin474]|nr:MAG: NAD(P)H-quinone oxidoreductase chain 4 1 [Verrucomicrobia bacterium ADurb.Bin474]